jgi:hypothetical protein
MKRGGTTDDVANACLFLASEFLYFWTSTECLRRNAYLITDRFKEYYFFNILIL